ncbi:MAG: hypothetical protein Q9194_002523 [Teloschistes cf. exilis]
MSGPLSPFSAEEFYCVKTLRNSQHTQTGRLSVEVSTHIMRIVRVRVCMEKSLHLKPSEFRKHLEEITDSAVKNACETVKTPFNAKYDEFYESKCAETKAIETWPQLLCIINECISENAKVKEQGTASQLLAEFRKAKNKLREKRNRDYEELRERVMRENGPRHVKD